MKISDLYPPPERRGLGDLGLRLSYPLYDRDVYIVGSGPSIDCWPDDALRNETCILLNDVCQFKPWGPIAFANNLRFLKHSRCKYNIVKGRLVDPKQKRTPGNVPTDNHCRWDDPNYYVFSYRSPYQGDKWDHFDDEALWKEPDFYWNEPGGTVAIFAMQFAVLAGARRIRCIGCDSSKSIMRYHAPKENRRNGKQVKHDYAAYQRGGCRMIREAWDRFGVMISHETPWIGYGMERDRYQEQLAWLRS